MQGMNFNYDSTYIQNTNQDYSNTQTLEVSDKVESSVSFMQMINSAKDEISQVYNGKTDYVSETDREVIKSSYDTAAVSDSSENSEKVEDATVQNMDVKKPESNAEKEVAEKTSDDASEKKNKTEAADAASFLARILNPGEKKSNTVNSDEKVLAAKKALNTFKDVNKVPSAQEKISSLKEKVDDEKLLALIKDPKEFKAGKKASEMPDAFEAQMAFAQKIKDSSNDLNKLSDKTASSKDAKELKVKKADKKLSDVIKVTDLRTEKTEAVSSEKKSQLTTTMKQTSNNSVAVTMDLNNQAEKNILSLDSQTAGAQGSNFQAMLENQIFENSADFVKAGKIVLKDNDVGNIDLILHPASLGNVKISLELSDKVITGKILVSSQEALEAFKATQESLKAAFIENGFDGASFDVAFANQNPDFTNAGQSQQDNSRQAKQSYGNYVVENTLVEELNSDIYNEDRDYSINIVA